MLWHPEYVRTDAAACNVSHQQEFNAALTSFLRR
jgi:hypothetical protein